MIKASFFTLIALVISTLAASAQGDSWAAVEKAKKGTLKVEYYKNHPFSYRGERGTITGIEIEILQEFVAWLKKTKEVELTLDYNEQTSFPKLLAAIKGAQNGTIAAGTITITDDRAKEMTFSPPYMKNSSMLVSRLNVPTLNDMSEFSENFSDLTALYIKGTIHEQQLKEIKDKYFPKLKVKAVDSENPAEIVSLLASNPSYFAFLDVITYWNAIRRHPGKFKIHREGNHSDERFGFALTKDSDWNTVLTEFFESGFGFTATEEYHNILRSHFPYEIIKEVELY